MHDRGKRVFSKGIHQDRSGIFHGLMDQIPVSLLESLDAPAPQHIVKKESQILPVVIAVLRIRGCASDPAASSAQMLGKEVCLLSGNN